MGEPVIADWTATCLRSGVYRVSATINGVPVVGTAVGDPRAPTVIASMVNMADASKDRIDG